jgi:hypothetical protein
MKKLGDVLKGVAGVLLLAGLAVVLAAILSHASTSMQRGQSVSPIETPSPPTATIWPVTTPTPPPDGLSVAPTPGGEYPWPITPDPAAEGKPISDAAPYTPPPPKEPKMYPIHTLDDVVAIALKDPFVQSRLESDCRKGAVPGTPVFVQYIGEDAEDGWGYYLVPFHKGNYIVLTTIVGVMGKQGASTGTIAECSCSPEAVATRTANPREMPQGSLYVSADEAKDLVEEEGHRIREEPRLVWRRLKEGADEFDPFWEFLTVDGESLYVIHKAGSIQIYRAVEVHPID